MLQKLCANAIRQTNMYIYTGYYGMVYILIAAVAVSVDVEIFYHRYSKSTSGCQSDLDFGKTLLIKLHKEKANSFSKDLLLIILFCVCLTTTGN